MSAEWPTHNELLLRRVPQALAVLLALGGCFWGLLLFPWLFGPGVGVSPMVMVVFGPGYLVTVAYIIRSVYTPPLGVRRLIWVASLLVQGVWLVWISWAMAATIIGGRTPNEPVWPVVWWVFATAASVAGLLTERANLAEQSATDVTMNLKPPS